MNYIKAIFLSAAFALAFAACGGSHDHEGHDADHHDGAAATETTAAKPHGEGAQFTSAYVCPMHCEGSGSDQAGQCPKCGMDYVAQAEHVKDGHTH